MKSDPAAVADAVVAEPGGQHHPLDRQQRRRETVRHRLRPGGGRITAALRRAGLLRQRIGRGQHQQLFTRTRWARLLHREAQHEHDTPPRNEPARSHQPRRMRHQFRRPVLHAQIRIRPDCLP